jgi:hypothetical protein
MATAPAVPVKKPVVKAVASDSSTKAEVLPPDPFVKKDAAATPPPAPPVQQPVTAAAQQVAVAPVQTVPVQQAAVTPVQTVPVQQVAVTPVQTVPVQQVITAPVPAPTPSVPVQKGPITSGLAIAALVLAFIFSPMGLIIGFSALSKIKRNPSLHGKGLAISAIIISIIAIIANVGFIIFALRFTL